MITGVYVDVWAHRTLELVETFFTAWHAAFYSGFLATAVWLVLCMNRLARQTGGTRLVAPLGYDTAVVGFMIFAAGGLFDFVWHTVRGIEQSFSALMSPPHLSLMTGATLILSAPFRAAWLSPGDRTPSHRDFAPALASLILTVITITLFMMFHWGFEATDFASVAAQQRFERVFEDTERARRSLEALTTTRGYTNVLLSNLVLFGPVTLMLRRWLPPLGTVAVLFTIVSTYMAGLASFHHWQWVVVAAGVGFGIDVLIHLLRPAPTRLGALRGVSIAGPVLLWGSFFGIVYVRLGIAWPLEVWVGTIIWSGISGWGLSLLAVPFAEL
jgi:hypothetical protein